MDVTTIQEQVKKTHPQTYLCNIFVDLETHQITFGFFDKNDENIHTFSEHGENMGGSKAVDPKNVPELSISENIVQPEVITEKANQDKIVHAKASPILKQFLLLQMFKEKLVWQYVGLTQSLMSISLRYDAITGEQVEATTEKLIDM